VETRILKSGSKKIRAKTAEALDKSEKVISLAEKKKSGQQSTK